MVDDLFKLLVEIQRPLEHMGGELEALEERVRGLEAKSAMLRGVILATSALVSIGWTLFNFYIRH